MDFSEFKRLLGADPRSRDPELLRARASSPEFEQAAADAERFEDLLARAVKLPVPEQLIDEIRSTPQQASTRASERRWWPMAMAAGLLIAIGAAGLTWRMNPSWDSVEDYVSDHYRHDGAALLAKADGRVANEVQTLLAEFNVEALPDLAAIVGVIKYCPTPDGKGVHMVLNSENGPVTVIYMPDTPVTDHMQFTFDGREALLVELKSGSAAIIGSSAQQISNLYALIQGSIVPAPGAT
jgi:hypothetical protein